MLPESENKTGLNSSKFDFTEGLEEDDTERFMKEEEEVEEEDEEDEDVEERRRGLFSFLVGL